MNEPVDRDTDRQDQDTLRVVFVPLPSGMAPDLVVTPREAVLFLGMSAAEFAAKPCEDIFCEVCHEFVASWRSLYSALDAADRAAVEQYLEEGDCRAPTFPQAIR
jgi:hypothetical protein